MTLAAAALGAQAVWGSDGLAAGAAIGILLAAFACEYVDSSLGMGYGTTLVPLLLLAGWGPLEIVPAVLLSELVAGAAAGLLHHRAGNVDLLRDRRARGALLSLGALSACGATVAAAVALSIPESWLTAAVAAIILSVGVLILATSRRRLAYRRSRMLALGAVAAFNKGLSGGGYGPLVTGGQVVSGIPPKHAVAVASLAEAATCLVGLMAYLLMGGSVHWPLAAPLLAGALLSVPAAVATVCRLPETFLRRGVGAAACLLGLLAFAKLL